MRSALGIYDWGIVGLYFGFVAVVALYASGKQTSTKEYFLGGRQLPWWAASLSIVATETSAVTFIGVPAIAYLRGDWSFMQLVLGFAIGRLFLAAFLIKVFYQDEYQTVYEYLGWRFGTPTRVVASLLFVAGRIAGSGVRLMAGCMAVGVAISAGAASEESHTIIRVAIVTLGIFGVAFTLFGGIRAVVWTDVLLGLTFMAGGVAAAAFLYTQLSETAGFGPEAFALKTRLLHISWNIADGKSLFAGLVGGFFLTLATHGTDQDIVQRMLTCRDGRQGSYSVLGSAVIILPLFLLFLLVGTLLSFFYAQPRGYDIPEQANFIFPVFIVRELPAGLSGFLIAGLLAAALSSLTSALNALAATTINDLYRPLFRHSHSPEAEARLLALSRWSTLGWGIVLVGMALVFLGGDQNIVNLALGVLAYFYGGLLGAFLLARFTTRGSSLSVIAGMLLSVPVVLLLQLRQFLISPEKAPSLLQDWLAAIPSEVSQIITEKIPEIAFPFWIILGTGVTLCIGILGNRRFAPRFRVARTTDAAHARG